MSDQWLRDPKARVAGSDELSDVGAEKAYTVSKSFSPTVGKQAFLPTDPALP